MIVRRLFHPATPSKGEIIRAMHAAGFDAVLKRYKDVVEPPDAWPKYLNLDDWIPVNLQRVRELALDQVRPGARVLDLGCGAGYFLYICQMLGHEVLGVDMDVLPMFNESCDVLGIPRVITQIKAFTPLPPLGMLFDYVTAFLICFNNHKSPELWGPAEWDFFLDDLAARLAPGGRVRLEFNREYNGEPYTPELKSFLERRGADIDSFRVSFTREQLVRSATEPAAI